MCRDVWVVLRVSSKLKTWLERFPSIWTPFSSCLSFPVPWFFFFSRLNAFLAEKRVSLEEKSYSITTPTAFVGLNRLDPWGFHLVNVLIHALVVQMIILLARYELNCGNHLTLMTSLFFATHPIHTEAVSFPPHFSSLSPKSSSNQKISTTISLPLFNSRFHVANVSLGLSLLSCSFSWHFPSFSS